jgi:DNA-binding NtrC family response regulator
MGPDTRTPAHVLVVATDDQVRSNLAALVRQVGYRSAVAPDLASARHLLEYSPIRHDVVLVDAAGSGKDVLDLAGDLGEHHDVGVVVVTDTDDIRAMAPTRDAGAPRFITVPVSAAKLLRAVAAVLRETQARRRNAWYADVVESRQQQRRVRDEEVVDITGYREPTPPPQS